ncbi:MAG: hypothetical protein ACP5JE_03835 [Thermoplasmata archaeon]
MGQPPIINKDPEGKLIDIRAQKGFDIWAKNRINTITANRPVTFFKAPWWFLEYLKKGNNLIIHLTLTPELKDTDNNLRTLQFISARIIKALSPIVPQTINVYISHSNFFRSWAIEFDKFYLFPANEMLFNNIKKALIDEFKIFHKTLK